MNYEHGNYIPWRGTFEEARKIKAKILEDYE